jgi:hypothetical protein
VGAKETEGASSSAVLTLLILVAVDLFVIDCGDTLGTPVVHNRSWPETIIGPVLLTIATPAILETTRTVEGEMLL